MAQQEQQYDTQADYECLWLPFIGAMKEIFPRYDSILCINEHRELAFFVVPEVLLSMTRVKVIYKQPNTDVAFIQRIYHQAEDKSYIAPIMYTDKQFSKLNHLVSSFRKGKIIRELGKSDWTNLISEVRENSLSYLHDPSLFQPLKRAQVIGKNDLTEPDDLNRWNGNQVPVYIYTSPGNELKFDRDKCGRLLTLRRISYEHEEAIEAIEDTLSKIRRKKDWLKDRVLIDTINKVEFELALNSETDKPQLAELILDPRKTELTFGPEPTVTLTPEGLEAQENLQQPPASGFSITDWGEPNIAQIVLHVGQPASEVSGAMTIIRDELGIHTLPSYLFAVSADTFGSTPDEYVLLHEVPASDIPEIGWEPITGDVPQAWWQTDTIVRRVLWLAVQNLMSHQIGEPGEVICSVTPMGDNALQVAIAEGANEKGTPYAFAIIADDLEVNAIPIFPSGTLEHRPDGSTTIKIKGGIVTKSYTITRQWERWSSTDIVDTSKLFHRPSSMFAKYYATKTALEDLQDQSYIGGMQMFHHPIYAFAIKNYSLNPSTLLALGNFLLG